MSYACSLYVDYNTVHNSKEWISNMSLKRWMQKMCYTDIVEYHVVQKRLKFSYMQQHRWNWSHYIKWKKLDTRWKLSAVFSHLWNQKGKLLEQSGTMTPNSGEALKSDRDTEHREEEVRLVFFDT